MTTTTTPDMTGIPSWIAPEDVPDWSEYDSDGTRRRFIEGECRAFDIVAGDQYDDSVELHAILCRYQEREPESGEVTSVDWIEVDALRLTAAQALRLAEALTDLAGIMKLEEERQA